MKQLSVFAVFFALVAAGHAQSPARGQAPPRQVTSPRDAYPARPAGDPAAIERGKALYGVNCQFCHGADTRGGDSGPSLLRSGIVLDDQHGELMAPVIQNGRSDRGMPKFAFNTDQIADLAAFIHTFRAAGYDESRLKPPSIVVGDAKAGEAYFGQKCAACHSASGDLKGLATKVADPRQLQQAWLMPGTGGGRGGPPPIAAPPTRVVVTLASGEKVSGVLDRVDDFVVSLRTDDGVFRSFSTTPGARGVTSVEIQDPLKPHKDLLKVYTDTDIHNLTAFLVTLK